MPSAAASNCLLDNIAIFGDAAGLTYFGGKNGSGVYHSLINLMPPHRVYIECFLGSGAVMRRKRPAAINIGIDLKLHPSFETSVLPAGSAEISIASAPGGNGDAGLRSHHAKEGDPRRRRRSADPAVSSDSGVNGEAVPRYQFIEEDGISFLESYPFQGDELIYCDPPYLMQTRSSGRKRYEHEMGEPPEHRRLLRVIRTIPAMVMISGYASVLYNKELKPWNVATFTASVRGGSERPEFVWYNFPRPLELHDYSFLGSNFRERENIQRQKKRWISRLETMPTLRRQALLAAIAETGGFADAGSRRRL